MEISCALNMEFCLTLTGVKGTINSIAKAQEISIVVFNKRPFFSLSISEEKGYKNGQKRSAHKLIRTIKKLRALAI